MAKEYMTPEEWERHLEHKKVEQEMEDLGFSSDLGVPPPTKTEIAKRRPFTESERALIYECLIDNDNDVSKALVDYNKFASDTGIQLKPATEQSLKAFRMRHIEDYCKHIATDIGLTAIMKVAKEGVQEQTRSLAGQYLMNRGFGMPTQKQELAVAHFSWEDVEAEKKRTIEQLNKSGEWHHATDSEPSTPAATDKPETEAS